MFDSPVGRPDTSNAGATARPHIAALPRGSFPEVVQMPFLTRWLSPKAVARAHCDLPCGVYDPEQARIEAESVYRIIEKYAANEDATFRTRAIAIKEERADLVKHHLDVLWHDYFKPEHLETVPNLHELFWSTTKQVSKVKAGTSLDDAKKLLDMIDEVDAAWKATGGNTKTRVAGRPG